MELDYRDICRTYPEEKTWSNIEAVLLEDNNSFTRKDHIIMAILADMAEQLGLKVSRSTITDLLSINGVKITQELFYMGSYVREQILNIIKDYDWGTLSLSDAMIKLRMIPYQFYPLLIKGFVK